MVHFRSFIFTKVKSISKFSFLTTSKWLIPACLFHYRCRISEISVFWTPQNRSLSFISVDQDWGNFYNFTPMMGSFRPRFLNFHRFDQSNMTHFRFFISPRLNKFPKFPEMTPKWLISIPSPSLRMKKFLWFHFFEQPYHSRNHIIVEDIIPLWTTQKWLISTLLPNQVRHCRFYHALCLKPVKNRMDTGR